MNELTKATEMKLFDSLHSKEYRPAPVQKKETFVLETGITGWEECAAIDTVIAGLREGDELTLIHEESESGGLTSVCDRYGQKIGYLCGGNRKIIARLMGAGKTFKAVLSPLEPDISDYEKKYPELIRRRKYECFLNMKIYWVE